MRTLVGARLGVRVAHDLIADGFEVMEDLTRQVEELAVLLRLLLGAALLALCVDKLEDERAAGDDTSTARQEIAAYNVLQDRTLARALTVRGAGQQRKGPVSSYEE